MAQQLIRAQVPQEQTWNLADLYPSRADWELAMAAIERDIATVTQYKGRLGEGARVLLACLTAQEALYERLLRAATYGELLMAQDGSDPANQEAADRAGALVARAQAEMSFVRSEMLALPDGTVARYLTEEPGLSSLRRFIEKMLAEKPHMLLPETEEVLAGLGEVLGAPTTIYLRTKAGDITFPPATDSAGQEVAISFARYEEEYETLPDVTLRRSAFAAFSQGLEGYKNALGATFATEVKKNVVLARARKYPSATHMLLAGQEVEPEIYHNLLDVIQRDLAPHMRRYAALRKRVLGLDKLLYCDIEAPMDPEFQPSISYAEASELIIGAMSVMGKEYTDIVRAGLKERWVDWCDNAGKSTGAFCTTPYGAHPFILCTWTDNMRSAFTLAHELGHAAHGILTEQNQRLANADVSLFFVEGPSTICELLLAEHIMASSNDVRMRRWVIMQTLQTYHHNFVRHLLEGELQRRMYAQAEEGQPITAATLTAIKGEILSQFWGDAVEIDEGARLTWMRQPHYYMGLYPYTYSAGLTTSTAVAQMIKEQGQPAVDRWLKALKAGGSLKPLELARLAGVDMATAYPVRRAVAYVGGLVSELEKSF